MPDRRLELDQRVRLVVLGGGVGLAVGAEVDVVADGALVANATDVRALANRAKRPVAADADMRGLGSYAAEVTQRLVDGYEAMVGVHEARVRDAGTAVIPVRAVQALVANTCDVLGLVSEPILGRGQII